MYSFAIAVPCSIAIFLVTFVLGDNLLISTVLSLMPYLLVVLGYLGDLRNPIEVCISPESIQFVHRSGKKEDVSWKNVVSLKPVPLDTGFYNLIYLRENGKKSFHVLSEEPAEKVRLLWIELYPDAKDLGSEPKLK